MPCCVVLRGDLVVESEKFSQTVIEQWDECFLTIDD